MLGRLQMSVDECITAYIKLSKRAFQPQRSIPVNFKGQTKALYNSDALEEASKEVIRSCNLDADSLLKSDMRIKVSVGRSAR